MTQPAAQSNSPSNSSRSQTIPNETNTLSLRLESYDYRALDSFIKQLISIANEFGGKVTGPTPMPTKYKLYTVKRSPHIDKKAQDQFERRTSKRVVKIRDLTPAAVEAVSKLHASASIYIKIK